MIKLEATKDFTLHDFNKLNNIKRKNENKNKDGYIYVGDIIECNKDMADYLLGNNDKSIIVVKVIEVIPDKDIKFKKTKRRLTTKK